MKLYLFVALLFSSLLIVDSQDGSYSDEITDCVIQQTSCGLLCSCYVTSIQCQRAVCNKFSDLTSICNQAINSNCNLYSSILGNCNPCSPTNTPSPSSGNPSGACNTGWVVTPSVKIPELSESVGLKGGVGSPSEWYEGFSLRCALATAEYGCIPKGISLKMKITIKGYSLGGRVRCKCEEITFQEQFPPVDIVLDVPVPTICGALTPIPTAGPLLASACTALKLVETIKKLQNFVEKTAELTALYNGVVVPVRDKIDQICDGSFDWGQVLSSQNIGLKRYISIEEGQRFGKRVVDDECDPAQAPLCNSTNLIGDCCRMYSEESQAATVEASGVTNMTNFIESLYDLLNITTSEEIILVSTKENGTDVEFYFLCNGSAERDVTQLIKDLTGVATELNAYVKGSGKPVMEEELKYVEETSSAMVIFPSVMIMFIAIFCLIR